MVKGSSHGETRGVEDSVAMMRVASPKYVPREWMLKVVSSISPYMARLSSAFGVSSVFLVSPWLLYGVVMWGHHRRRRMLLLGRATSAF